MKQSSFVSLLFLSAISINIHSQTLPEAPIPPAPVASSENRVYEKVEVEAGFPGGDKAWISFLTENLNAQVPIDHEAPIGKYTVWVQFLVDKEGNVTDIKSLTNWGYGMEEEVVRILKLVPDKWTPAIQNGRPVKAYRKQPVTFVVDQDGFEVNLDHGDFLYVGIDNPVTIKIEKIKAKKLEVGISQGSIVGKKGKYIVHVTTVGRAVIDVYDETGKIGSASFEVRPQQQKKS